MADRFVVTDSVEATLYVQRAVAAMRRNWFSEALLHLDAALELQPLDPVAHWNRATSLLSLGEYVEGFKEFEWRWKMYDWRWGLLGEDIYRVRDLTPWRGEDPIGKRILFYWEMGYGDGIQQLRYVPVLREMGAIVTVMVVPPLKRLAGLLCHDVVTEVPTNLEGYDYRCSLFGVMRAMRQKLRDIPRNPYLPIDITPVGGMVGLAWSGRTQTNFTLPGILSSLSLGKYCLQSLQLEGDAPPVLPLPVGDFLDTARLLGKMQHVVTVDTAVAHLAGAIGHPSAHLLLPFCSDWRWNHAGCWYPTLKIYRQPAQDDWVTPLSNLNKFLKENAP